MSDSQVRLWGTWRLITSTRFHGNPYNYWQSIDYIQWKMEPLFFPVIPKLALSGAVNLHSSASSDSCLLDHYSDISLIVRIFFLLSDHWLIRSSNYEWTSKSSQWAGEQRMNTSHAFTAGKIARWLAGFGMNSIMNACRIERTHYWCSGKKLLASLLVEYVWQILVGPTVPAEQLNESQ